MYKPKLNKSQACILKYNKLILYQNTNIVLLSFGCEKEVIQHQNKPHTAQPLSWSRDNFNFLKYNWICKVGNENKTNVLLASILFVKFYWRWRVMVHSIVFLCGFRSLCTIQSISGFQTVNIYITCGLLCTIYV